MKTKKTRHLPFHLSCADEPRLFSVNPGLDAADALEQASSLLRCATAISFEMTDGDLINSRELTWASILLTEMAGALVDSVRDRTTDCSGSAA